MNAKLNVQELFFQLKNKKQNQIKSFDRALCSLGIHQELEYALVPVVVKCEGGEKVGK